MYLGVKDLNRLRAWIDGYYFALHARGISLESDELLFLNDFHDWTAYKLHFYESTSGWANMILERGSDGDATFDLFEQLFVDLFEREPILIGVIEERGIEKK